MTIPRLEAVAVFNDYEVAVIAGRRRVYDLAIGGRVDRVTLVRRNVEARVEIFFASQRIRAVAHARRQPAVRRPDGGRRGGELIALVDVGAHGLQTALEALQ